MISLFYQYVSKLKNCKLFIQNYFLTGTINYSTTSIYPSLWLVLILASKGLILLTCIWISWILRKLFVQKPEAIAKASNISSYSPTNNALLACAVFTTTCLLQPIIEHRAHWPQLYRMTVVLNILIINTAVLLLTQLKKFRQPKITLNLLRSSNQSPGNISEEALNLITQLKDQITAQEKLITQLSTATAKRSLKKDSDGRTSNRRENGYLKTTLSPDNQNLLQTTFQSEPPVYNTPPDFNSPLHSTLRHDNTLYIQTEGLETPRTYRPNDNVAMGTNGRYSSRRRMRRPIQENIDPNVRSLSQPEIMQEIEKSRQKSGGSNSDPEIHNHATPAM